MDRIAKLMADWRVVVGAICGLPLAGFTVSMMLWGQPAKASVVAAQGEVVISQGKDLAAAKQGFADLNKAMDRQEQRTMRVEDKLDAMNEKLDRFIISKSKR